MNNRVLGSIVKQRERGVQVHHSLKAASQVDRVNKQAFSTLAFIAQTIEYRSWNIMLRWYRTLVSHFWNTCVQFWLPCYRKDIIKLEGVQKRFTRMLLGLDSLSYKHRLDNLGLFLLESRRLKGGHIEVDKIMRGIDKVKAKVISLEW
eukprot:g43326.t1